MRICQNRVIDLQRARTRRREYRGVSAIRDHQDSAELTRAWDEEKRLTIFTRAMETLREETRTSERTIRAFELVAIEQHPAERVAESLGITTAEVYRIKNRVTTRLRQIVEQLTAAYETDA
jgi:DNA-directed RNA polymerase specialized sigma24 family protein